MAATKNYMDLPNLSLYDILLKDFIEGKVIELTKAEYDALPESKYTDGKTYYLTDAYSGGDGTVSWLNITDKPITNTITDSSDIPTASAVKTYVDTNASDSRIDSSITHIGVDQSTGILQVTFNTGE